MDMGKASLLKLNYINLQILCLYLGLTEDELQAEHKPHGDQLTVQLFPWVWSASNFRPIQIAHAHGKPIWFSKFSYNHNHAQEILLHIPATSSRSWWKDHCSSWWYAVMLSSKVYKLYDHMALVICSLQW